MTRDQLLEQLRPLDPDKVPTLAPSLAATSRAPARAAVELLQGSDEDVATNARVLLRNLEDLAIVPLLETNPASPKSRVDVVSQAVEAELALRRKLMARLDKLLDDRTPVPLETRGHPEEKPPPRRVCDEAYVLMRQVVNFPEPIVDANVQAKMFLNSPDDFKDAQIKKARQSGVWNRALTGKDYEEYESQSSGGSHPSTPRR